MIQLNIITLAHATPGRRQTVTIDKGSSQVGDFQLAFLRGELVFTRIDEAISVNGTLATKVKTTCTRCLEDLWTPLQIKLADEITLPGAALTPEHPVRVENGLIDLAPLLLQYIWLELPSSPVCSPDCQGFCHQCGQNLNYGECDCEDTTSPADAIDPRWEALHQLKTE